MAGEKNSQHDMSGFLERTRIPQNISGLMPREPDGIREAIKKMFAWMKDEGNNPNDSEEYCNSMIEDILDAFFDWVGNGDTENINQLLGVFRKSSFEDADDIIGLDALPQDNIFKIQIQMLHLFFARFLIAGNLAKSAGKLSGEKGDKLRIAIRWIYRRNKIASLDELVKAEVFPSLECARESMDHMSKLGLFERVNDEGNGTYDLTWYGRDCGREL